MFQRRGFGSPEGGSLPRRKSTVDKQQQHGAQRRHEESGRLAGLIPSERPPEEPGYERSSNAERYRHEHAARVTARHEKLGEDTDDQAEYDPSKDAEHVVSFRLAGECRSHQVIPALILPSCVLRPYPRRPGILATDLRETQNLSSYGRRRTCPGLILSGSV